VVIAAVLPGCLWIPGIFKEKADPPAPQPDTRAISHCRPHAGRPMLLGSQTGERIFGCRVANPPDADWRLSFPETVDPRLTRPAVDGFLFAEGVEAIRLDRDDLPWSPHPYEAILELDVPDDGESREWRIIVIPHVDDMWPLPDPGSEG